MKYTKKNHQKIYDLPVDHSTLNRRKGEIRMVREQYIKEQNNICFYCNESLSKDPPKSITNKDIMWELFPKHFMEHPIHLDHDHITGMTRGAVHAYCNAVMWQYEGK